MSHLPAYREIVVTRLRSFLVYRQNVAFLLLILVLQVFVLTKVWTALYAGADAVNGLSLSAVLTYLTIANLQHWALQDIEVSLYVQSRVREGHVVFDLLRPQPYVGQLVAHLVGSSLGMVGFAIAALPVLMLVGTLSLPASPAAFGLWLASMLLGFAVATMINLSLALAAFWTTEIMGVTMLYQLVGQFFAGTLLPLTFLPDALATLAAFLPFQATTYTPVVVYVGQLTGSDAVRAVGVQALWVLLLGLAVRLLWQRASRRLFVQGG